MTKLNEKLIIPISGSSGDNHYIKFSDGTLICYGLCPETNTAHNKTSTASVSFAESFISDPSINLSIRATNEQSAQYLFAQVGDNPTGGHLTGFTLRTRNSGTATSGQDWAARVYYQAIGKWK